MKPDNYDNHLWDSRGDGRMTRRTVVSATAFDGVEIYPQGSRAGSAERERTAAHIRKMADRGYITGTEAIRRTGHAMTAEKTTELAALISDLPPYETRRKWQLGNSGQIVALIAGVALSLMTAIIPAMVLGASDQEFPKTIWGLGVGTGTIILGIVGTVACIAGLIAKTT